MTIRSHLLLLAALAALPVLVFSVLISIMLIDQEQRTFERSAVERARAMMSAIDAELRGSFATLDALAASRFLLADDLPGFRDSADRLLGTQPGWYNVTLAVPSGQKIMDLRTPLGAPPELVIDWPSGKQVLETRQAVVGNVVRQGADSLPLVALRRPIIRDGAIRYILTAQVRSDSFKQLIHEQQLPGDWISGLVDGNGNFIARDPPLPAGVPASAAFRAEIARAREGWYRGPTVEGRDTFTAYQRSAVGDWTIGIAIPVETVLGAARRTAWMLGFGVLTAAATTLVLAYFIGKRIAGPMTALADLAGNIGGDGAAPTLRPADVREVNEVGYALLQADAAARERRLVDQREREAIGAADRAKDEFIATLSHELRNPLAALTSAAEILRRNDLDADAGRDARAVIERQVGHMSRMIEDLLDLSRVLAGKTHLKIERFDLAALASAVVAAWRLEGRIARHVVTVESNPAWIDADRTRMEQVLANLLDNAVKFTAPGTHVRIAVAAVDGRAELTVADDGPGIAPEMLGRVFDPFVQGAQALDRAGGLGLGLALVKRLVELQQGTVSVESAGARRGATFRVSLPRVEPVPAESATALDAAAAGLGRKRVLVIDDNDDARRSLAVLLSLDGHEAYEAANGARGVDLASHVRPDVALVDIGLPDIDGHEVARRIRAELPCAVALFAVTGCGQPEDQRQALEAGFDAHLVKPVTLEQLNEALAKVHARAPVAASD